MTLTTRQTFATRDEWLRARRIGSSDVAPILGLSTYRGPWSVYARLVEGERDDSDSPDAARGRALEGTVLRQWSRATGIALARPEPHTLYTRDEWATASPDAVAADGRLVEAKTDRFRDRWGEPQTIERWTPEAAQVVRRDYYLQVAHQLYVLDRDRADLAVLVPGDDPFIPELRIYTVLRDLEVEEALVETLRGWWDLHIRQRVPPELDGSDAASAHLGQLHRAGARRATVAETALAAGYVTARAHALAAEHERKRIGQLLTASAGTSARLDLPRGHVSIVRQPGKVTLDERALLADHPELSAVLDRYRRTSNPYAYPAIAGLEP
jgi:putative phage-type endonuclease